MPDHKRPYQKIAKITSAFRRVSGIAPSPPGSGRRRVCTPRSRQQPSYIPTCGALPSTAGRPLQTGRAANPMT